MSIDSTTVNSITYDGIPTSEGGSQVIQSSTPKTAVAAHQFQSADLSNGTDAVKDKKVTTQKQLQKTLQNTYCFSSKDAESIVNCTETFGKKLEEVNVSLSFKTKVQSLIAKVCQFFGSEKPKQKLQQKVLGNLRNVLIKNPEDSTKLLDECLKNESAKAGLYWILFPNMMADLEGNLNNLSNAGFLISASFKLKDDILSIDPKMLKSILDSDNNLCNCLIKIFNSSNPQILLSDGFSNNVERALNFSDGIDANIGRLLCKVYDIKEPSWITNQLNAKR